VRPPRRPRSAFLTAGFRPFFLGAGIWAATSMALWLLVLSGRISLTPPFDWHAHEMVFGYLSAAMAGFLLTAAPS
jgi:uncharacterized protein involved in response to NO